MKVLFAVNNENISTQIVKKFQKDYKEIITYKNMYYFDAIIKELQRNGTYDRIVISEDLEPFSNNNYDAIDKFLFEKLDNISDEAAGNNGKNIPIILITAERRMKADPILVKFFGIGIYNALLGQDRNTSNICELLNNPRTKKDAKTYYQIESDEVDYKTESEDNVSEAEIKNILNHYKRLGKDEDRYIESFNNIAAQYNDAQLRIITKFLPLNVKAVLEEKSPKYQSVMTFRSNAVEAMKKEKKENGLKIGFLKDENNKKPSSPVIVPKAVKKEATKKIQKTEEKPVIKEEKVFKEIDEESNNIFDEFEEITDNTKDTENINDKFTSIEEKTEIIETVEPIVKKGRGRPRNILTEEELQIKANTVKRGRGRPKNVLTEEELQIKASAVKRGRGRPKKITLEENKSDDDIEETILPGFEDIKEEQVLNKEIINKTKKSEEQKNDYMLPGIEGYEEDNNISTQIKDHKENVNILPGFDEIEDDDETDIFSNDINNSVNSYNKTTHNDYYSNNQNNTSLSNYSTEINNVNKFSGILSKDKKIVSFVGTTKNGTSFLVNNLAKCLSTMGIKTAILDLTTNRNSYYIYTNNEDKLRNIALESIKKLKMGNANGIPIDKNLDVYTALPGENVHLEDVEGILSTLSQNYSVVLMDCDFNTIPEYFESAQEIYVVQTMDILTIQPMTAFLRDLKAKNILEPEKIKIVINKEMRVRGLTAKAIIGGLSSYNDPAMAFMTKLFDKDMVKYCVIPFEEETCARYLEGVMECSITINGYSKNFNMKLKELANMVYPLIGGGYKNYGDYSGNSKFSQSMNSTLEQMKNRY